MRQSITFLVLATLFLALTGCVRPPNPDVEFARHAWTAHRGEAGEPVETVYYADDAERPRYRTYGVYRDRADGRWGVSWADYGRVSQYRYEATHYPNNPLAMFATREEAIRAAERAAIEFRFEVDVHSDPLGAPGR